jgi:hypothetical protein
MFKVTERGHLFGGIARYQKVSTKALFCGTVNVPISPLPPSHLYLQGGYTYREGIETRNLIIFLFYTPPTYWYMP